MATQAQNVYDNQDFFAGYSQLPRSVHGLSGAPEWSSIKALLPEIKDTSIIDLGCGLGWFARYVHDQGASKIRALDISEKMIQSAKNLSAGKYTSIQYEIGNLENLTLPQNAYNLVYSSLALHYIVRLPELLKTIYESLVPGGKFVFSAEHPIFTCHLNPRPDWYNNKNDMEGGKSWPVQKYNYEGERRRVWFGENVIKQHRTMGTYINTLINCGFTICHVEEWTPTEEQIAKCPELLEEKDRPMFLLMSVQKK